MPVNIFLKNETAEPEYETIEKDELTHKDTVVETVIEPAKTEEKEKEDGTKETVEVEPSREKYKILKRPVALNDTDPLWNKPVSYTHLKQCRKPYKRNQSKTDCGYGSGKRCTDRSCRCCKL